MNVMILFKEKIDLPKVSVLAIGLWFIALVLSMIIMGVLGVDPQTDNDWGVNHKEYWVFEAIIIPLFVLISIVVLTLFFRKFAITEVEWKVEGLVTGIVIMAWQFVLDTIVLVFLFSNGLDYFIAMVTISYLFIPLWALLARFISLRT